MDTDRDSSEAVPTPGDTICGEIILERLISVSLGAELFQPLFVARHLVRDETLWLAVIDGSFLPSTVDMSTFMARANALIGVRHPSLVRVVLVDREEDYCVVGYEQLPGAEALGDLIIRGPTPQGLARTAVEVARGLAFLHQRSRTHGALTPGTVVLWEGVPVLWEYGLAELCDRDVLAQRVRTSGVDIVAPEVIAGASFASTADVFAWGAVVAALASGTFGSEAVSAVRNGRIDRPSSAPMMDLVRHALDPDPNQRPRDGMHLLELLLRSLSAVKRTPDPRDHLSSSNGPSDSSLQELARRYVVEMERVVEPSSMVESTTSPVSPASDGTDGSVGRMALVQRRSHSASGPRFTPPGQQVESPHPRQQSERVGSGPVVAEPGTPRGIEPDWTGRYRLPSSAAAQVPRTVGPGLVRGPEPGVSGSDAGLLSAHPTDAAAPSRAESGASARSRSLPTGASGWLRPASARVGAGGIFNADQRLQARSDGVRKRSILNPGSVSFVSTSVPPAGTPIPMGEDDVTPPEPTDLVLQGAPEPEMLEQAGFDLASILNTDLPQSERETPVDIDVLRLSNPSSNLLDGQGTEPATEEPALGPEDEALISRVRPATGEIELPPVVASELPPLIEPEASQPPGPTESTDRLHAVPFRMPRTPGPHGPPAAVMALVLATLGGLVVLATTLGAISISTGVGNFLWGDESQDATSANLIVRSDSVVEPMSSGPTEAERCPTGMVEIRGGETPYCIDRAEYPGIDRIPAIDVSLAHAHKACEVRGYALCTEAQWDRACRGRADWSYPYAAKWRTGRCRVGDKKAHPGPAGADPLCITPEGVVDLVGNVAEWTHEGVVRGGSIRSKASIGCESRQRLRPTTTRPTLGFRCCTALFVEGSTSFGQD